MAKLLIVDDDAVDRELAARCVEAVEDLEIIEAGDGREALEICAEGAPDIVVTDLRMPHLDGLALVTKLREQFPLLPVILMTARGSERIAVEALAAGADSYVAKADMAGVLGDTVAHLLAVSEKRHERAALMGSLRSSSLRFELDNDLSLISPLVAFVQDELERFGFADDRVRSQLGTALYEALSNAMIHGNLEVGSELRDAGSGPYHRLIAERRGAKPWSERRVHCGAEHRRDQVRYVIRDEGDGFDRSAVPDPTRPESMLKARGRGLFLMNAFMDEVDFNEAGNEVRLVKRA